MRWNVKGENTLAGVAVILAAISIIAVVVMMLALREHTLATTEEEDELLVPTQVTEDEAREIALKDTPGTLLDSRATRAVADIRGRGANPEAAWEIQIQRPNSDFVDLVFVAMSDGKLIRTSTVSIREFEGDEYLIPPEDALEEAKVENRLVHAKEQGKFAELCWEVRVQRPGGEFTDVIYVAVDDGEVIRTDTVPTKSLD